MLEIRIDDSLLPEGVTADSVMNAITITRTDSVDAARLTLEKTKLLVTAKIALGGIYRLYARFPELSKLETMSNILGLIEQRLVWAIEEVEHKPVCRDEMFTTYAFASGKWEIE